LTAMRAGPLCGRAAATPAIQHGGEDGALGRQRFGVTAPPGLGEADVDPAPVQVTQGALDQAVLRRRWRHTGPRST
jgi:hypothetical protein